MTIAPPDTRAAAARIAEVSASCPHCHRGRDSADQPCGYCHELDVRRCHCKPISTTWSTR